MTKSFDISKHQVVPKHSKLGDKDKEKLLEKYNISVTQLPKILKNDAAIKALKLKQGDVVKIIRESPNVGTIVFYRGVVNG